MSEYSYPTERVDLPSKGLLYSKDNPLSQGFVDMKYMTAKEEDILTNQNYIQKGVVIDKLLQSLIVSECNYNDILIGDKNAILIAARILGYGKDYEINYIGEKITVDLTQLNDKVIDSSIYESGKNEFSFELPASKKVVTFKVLTHGDSKKIDEEIEGLKKLQPNSVPPIVSTNLKHTLLSVDGNYDRKTVREFAENMLAIDSRALRKEINRITPDIDMSFTYTDSNGDTQEGVLPIGIDFFWPDLAV